MCALPHPNSFIFMQFSTKKSQNNRLAHLLLELRPSQENPGSATECVVSLIFYLLLLVIIMQCIVKIK